MPHAFYLAILVSAPGPRTTAAEATRTARPCASKFQLPQGKALSQVTHSQLGENLHIVRDIFIRVGNGTYTEIGGHDGVMFSNTLMLNSL